MPRAMKAKTDPSLEFQNLDEVAEFISTIREKKHFCAVAEALADWAAGELGRDLNKEQTEELAAIGQLIALAMVAQQNWDHRHWARWFDEPILGDTPTFAEQLLSGWHKA
jgi:hypothetical protein